MFSYQRILGGRSTYIRDFRVRQHAISGRLTHTVDYQDYPNSLRVYCVFDTKARLDEAELAGNTQDLTETIIIALQQNGVLPRDATATVLFDTEQTGAHQRLLA